MRGKDLVVAALVGACAGEAATTDELELIAPKTATLRIGLPDQRGDGIDLITDEQFAFGSADLRVYRSSQLLMTGRIGGDAPAQLAHVGVVATLADVPLPPSFDPTNVDNTAVAGGGIAVRTQHGCIAAARVSELHYGQAYDGSGNIVDNA